MGLSLSRPFDVSAPGHCEESRFALCFRHSPSHVSNEVLLMFYPPHCRRHLLFLSFFLLHWKYLLVLELETFCVDESSVLSMTEGK